jgi:photosystem II stability/assembly factor-like uncharacterized protein
MGKPSRQQRRAQERKQAKQDPPPKTSERARRPWWPWLLGALGVFLLVGFAIQALPKDTTGGKSATRATAGLPDTPDYHSLLVAPDDPKRIFLGTHFGLFESADGGNKWRATNAFEGDAMNLARTKDATLYAAGHQLFKRSSDGGKTWEDVPLDDAISETRAMDGEKSVDIHGFAIDPVTDALYVAAANRGLFRSTDDARSFTKLSDTGAAAMGVAVAGDDPLRIYLGDARQGLLVSDNEGKSWEALQEGVTSVAVHPSADKHLLAGGQALYVSQDGGKSFTPVLENEAGIGPVTFAPSDPKIAYAIGLDGTFHVSRDGGKTWTEA